MALYKCSLLLPGLVFALAVTGTADASDFDWRLPKGFPRPAVPADNPITTAKAELGRHLFYDVRLSGNSTQSCATCHRQELAFTDGRSGAVGSTGESHPRSSMSLVNVAYMPLLTWANPSLGKLEDQALIPMLGVEPLELGLKGYETRLLSDLRHDPKYQRLFAAAFPDKGDPYTLTNAVKAIATFERTIISMRSPYDRYRYGGDQSAISTAAKRGELIFFSGERGGCFQCHGGWNFSGAVSFEGGTAPKVEFNNTGLYNLPGATSYPEPNTGLHQFTHQSADVGKFRAPTLRNVAITAPYMHDGSIQTLDEVIDHYAAGGRASSNPNKSPVIKGFSITAQEKRDLIEFLNTLTDRELLADPRFSNPWPPKIKNTN